MTWTPKLRWKFADTLELDSGTNVDASLSVGALWLLSKDCFSQEFFR
ncbi:hypothetical protein A3Q41_01147 [Rhodococcoides fascians]|uniref:Uncharacterized protein n=1 Tax=Rhodococcoides fascians TaxID=1828 RepID=A0A143QI65_RHOFA|nr:hypothetical protein A3Q41_01147 [Rhodococcus fascians]